MDRLFQVIWKNGTITENVGYEESMALIKARPNDWAGVRSMDYGKDCSPENAKVRAAAWGKKHV